MEIVSKIVDHIINPLKESVGRHFGYLICYKKKIQELESEIEKLKDEKTRIQGMVDRAKDCAEEIEAAVSRWLTDVQNREDDVGEFLKDKVNENEKCFKCWCPDLTWRYRLGKGAEEKKASVITLKDDGREFAKFPVAHPAPFPEELLQFASSGDYMNFKSRASVFNEIMGALKDSEVNLIGVHGPGGAGKTTLVEEAAKQAKKDGVFDEIVMAVVSKDANVRKIQSELAEQLNLKYKEGQEELGRAGQLWNRLKEGNRKILVIMDDVWQQLHMKEIGIPIAVDGRGCKVLLTTRRERVCQKMEVQKDFPIGVLEEQEAWSLFKKVVRNVPTEVAQSKAEDVCKECGGLPVAIVAVGAALKGKEGHVWDDALNQLKNSSVQEIPDIDPKMYTSLKWSYDYLEHEDAKSCFLLCCLFPEDANIPIEDLVRHCMALRLLRHAETVEKARSRVQAMVDLLKSSCLLLRGRNENHVKMHDVIRDVAISITNGKQEGQQWPNKQQFLVKHGVQKWPEEGTWEHFTAVSIRAEGIDELPGDLQCPELHTLLLDCATDDLVDVSVLPDPFFNGMKKLTVLRLEGDMLSLPSAFTNLVNLRMLQISDCLLRDMAMIKNLKSNLEILILESYNIEELAPEIGELTRLWLLDLEGCYKLKVIPQGVIAKLIRLEELYIPEEFDQWEGSTTSNKDKSNVSLTELKSLKQLTTLHIHIPDVTLLPDDLSFENLIKFQISVGGKFDWGDRQYSSRTLKLKGFRLKAEFNGLIHRAEMLHLDELEGLETLFHGTHDRGFSNLKYLKVIDCHDLVYLLGKPEWLASELTELHIQNCSRLKYLCSSFSTKKILKLRQLRIIDCEIMEGIVEIEKERDEEEPENVMIDFSQLREMKLVKLPKLISFYPEIEKTIKENPYTAEQSLFNEKVVFPALEKLCIEALQHTDILGKQLFPISGQKVKSFCQLKDLTIKTCSKVVNVIPSNMVHQLQNLQNLSIYECNSVISLVEELNTEGISEIATVNEELPCLRNVKLVQLPNLIKIGLEEKEYCFHRIPICPNLTTLEIRGCDKMRNVFSSFVLQKLEHLEKLHIWQCPNMRVIVSDEEKEEEDYVIKFPQLSDLELKELPNLKSFKTSKFEAQFLFNHQVVFPKLKKISLARLREILDLRPVMTNVEGSLEEMRLEGFDQITLVSSPHLMERSVSLHKLVLRNCLRVTQPSDLNGPNGEEGQVEPRIEVKLLRLYGLTELACLWKKNLLAVLDLRYLKSLTVHKCSILRNLFTYSVASSFKQLSALIVKSCELMEEVVTNKGEEDAIDEVNIEFPKLSLLSLYNLPNLESFCSANYNFNFPSLIFVRLRRCPKMQAFTSRQARMQKIAIITKQITREEDKVEGFWVGDINKYLKGEEIGTRINADIEWSALEKKLRRELGDNFKSIAEEYHEYSESEGDAEDEEPSESAGDPKDEEPSEFDINTESLA